MKKRIALFSACALLVGLFSFAMMPVSAAGPSAFFYRYDSAESYADNVGDAFPDQTVAADAIPENWVKTYRQIQDETAHYTHRTMAYTWGKNAGGNTVLAYDATKGAMKVTIAENYSGNKADYPDLEADFAANNTTINRPGQVTFMAENDINTSTKDYPYFAIMIKLANKDYAYGSASISTNANAAQGFAPGKVASAGYQATTDWQLLVIKANDLDVQWRSLIVGLLGMDTVAVSAGQEVGWIKWAGAFATEADAEAQFTADGGVLPEKEDTTTKSPLMVDFTTQAKFDVAIAGQNLKTNHPENGSFSYDAGAAKITLTGTANQDGRVGEPWLYINPTNQMPVAGNEVVVVKMKINCTRETAQGFLTYAHYTKAGDKQIDYGNHTYKQGDADVLYGKDGWIYAAYTSKDAVTAKEVAADATWGEFRIIPHGSLFNTNDSFSIAWVGAFEDLASAKRWDETGSTEKPGYADDFFFNFADTQVYKDLAVANGKWRGTGENIVADNVFGQENWPATSGLAYDVNEKAIKFVKKDGVTAGNIGFAINPANGGVTTSATYNSYPIFALKVKMAVGARPNCVAYMKDAGGWSYTMTTSDTYTGEWQLITFKANSYDATTWRGANVLLMNNPANFEDGATIGYVQWAGAFESVAAAQDYFAATTESSDSLPSIAAKPDSASDFYMDFTQGAVVSEEWWAGSESNYARPEANTALSYDANAGALKVTTKPGQTTAGEIAIDFTPGSVVSNSVTTATHPIFAVKIKVVKTDILPGTYASMNGSTTGPYLRSMGNVYKHKTGTNPISPQGYLFNAFEEDWQLIVVDAVNNYDNYGQVSGNSQAKDNNFNTWRGVRIRLSSNLYDPALYDGTAEDIAYIQWAGTFESVAAAEAHFAATTQAEKEEIEKGAMYLDYRFPDTTNYFFYNDNRYHKAYGNSQYAFDLSEKAIKISSLNKTDSNIGGMQLAPAPHYVSTVHPVTGKNFANDLTLYPVYAVKIKFANANLKIKTASACRNGFGSNYGDVTFSEPNGTTDWQMLYFIADPTLYKDGQLSYVRIDSLTDDTSLLTSDVTDLAWIQWAGAFASVEDAQAWFDYTTPAESDDDDDDEQEVVVDSALSCTTAGIRKELVDNAQGLRFYQTLKTTIGDDGNEYVNGKKVVHVNVLMATAATVGNNELTVDFAAANAKVADVRITNCRSRVVDGDTATYVFTALLTDVSKQFKDTDVTCRAYIVLEDGTVVYGNVATTSVSKMYNAIGAAKFSKAVQDWMK